MNKAGKVITKFLTGIMGVAILGCAGILLYSKVASLDAKYEVLEKFANRNVSENTVTATVESSTEEDSGAVVNNTVGETGAQIQSETTVVQGMSESTGTNGGAGGESGVSFNANDAKLIASAYTGIDDLCMQYDKDLSLEGSQYYAFTYKDSYGNLYEPLILVNKNNGKTYYCDAVGNLRDAGDSFTAGASGDFYGNPSAASGAQDLVTLSDNSHATRGIYCGMNVNTVVSALLASNGITPDSEQYKNYKYAPIESGDHEEGNDMFSAGNQNLFGLNATVCFNFDQELGYETYAVQPVLEEIRVYFPFDENNYDADFSIEKQFRQILGEPSGTKQNDIMINHYWFFEKDVVTLTYLYQPEISAYAVKSFRIESLAHVNKRAQNAARQGIA